MLKLELQVKLCISFLEKVGGDENTLAVSSPGPLLSAISQTRPNLLFSQRALLIASLLSKPEHFSSGRESSPQIGVTISNDTFKSWTGNVPVQQCAITSIWLFPSRALCTVKFPITAYALTENTPNSSNLNFTRELRGKITECKQSHSTDRACLFSLSCCYLCYYFTASRP